MARRRTKRPKRRNNLKDQAVTLLLVFFALFGVAVGLGDRLVPLMTGTVLLALLLGLCYGGYRIFRRYRIRVPGARARARSNVRARTNQFVSRRFERRVLSLVEADGYRVRSLDDLAGYGITHELLRDGRSYALMIRESMLDRPLPEAEVRKFHSYLVDLGYSYGMFVTDGRFVPSARAWAERHGIVLQNGAALLELEERHRARRTGLFKTVVGLMWRRLVLR